MPKLKTQNFVQGTISGSIPSSGSFSVTLSSPPSETRGFITFEPANVGYREVVYYHNKVGSTIYVSSENRPSPKAHSNGITYEVTNVAEMFNTLSSMSSYLGFIEKTGGLNITVFGDTLYDNDEYHSVPDTSITLPASQTNYIYLDMSDYTIKQTLTEATANSNYPLCTVVSGASSVGTVTYTRATIVGGKRGPAGGDESMYVTVGFSQSDYICDGTADNVQIQSAIDAVTTNGGTVLIKEGTYNFANNIQLKSNVRIIGTGAGTILKAGGSHGGVIYQGSTIAPVNASIEAITIDANNIANVSAVQIYKFNGLKIKDCTVKNVNGIWGLKLGDYGADPVTAKSYGLEICNLKIDNANSGTYEPLLTSNTDGINIDGLNVSNCDLTNASLVSIFLLSKNVRITNSYFKSVTDDFGLLDITGSDNVVVTGNTFIHDGTTGNNAIVNRNTNNVLISGNTFNGKTMAGAGGAGVIVLDWSGTIDGHTNPYPYTENISILNNVFSGFYYGVNFSNTDASTNCGAKNVNISGNQFIGFDFSALTTRHVSGRDSENLVFSSNIVKPRTAGDKNLVWFRASGSYQNKKCVFIGNTFLPTTSDNTSVFVFEKADNVSFGPNYTEARGTGTVYSLGTSTNVTYTTGNNTGDETNSTILAKIGYTPANDLQVLHLSGNESVGGRKHFSNNDTFLGSSNKSYVNIGNLGTNQEVYVDARSDVYSDVDLILRAKGANGDVKLFTNSNEVLSVLASGNIGVGETAPDYKMDVNGSFGITPGIGTTVTPVDNGDLVFETTSNTSVNLKLKGSDGVVRTFPITLAGIAGLIITGAALEIVYGDVINVLTIIQNIPS